jgi:hypothetical protein
MARPVLLSKPQTLTDEQIARARNRQGEKAQKVDDAEAHVIRTTRVAKTERAARIHEMWKRDPGDADIVGVDVPLDQKIDVKRREERRKAGEYPPPPAKPGKPVTKKESGGVEKRKAKFKESLKPGEKFKGYKIIGGTPAERQVIDQTIKANWSKGERDQIAGLVIQIGSGSGAGKGAAGVYLDDARFAKANVLSGGRNKVVTKKAAQIEGAHHFIKIGKRYVHGSTITHELAHHIRAQRYRAGAPKEDLSARYSGVDLGRIFFDHDREESGTDLETIARHNKWESNSPYAKDSKGNRRIERPDPTGYYQFIKKPEHRTTQDLENEDRAIMTLEGTLANRKKRAGGVTEKKNGFLTQSDPDEKLRTSGIQGKKLRSRINKRWSETNIGNSRLGKGKITGKAEHLDQYFATLDKDGNVTNKVHIRSARLKKGDKEAISLLKGDPRTARIVKYNDGKPRTIARPPKSSRKRLTLS